MLQQKLEVFCDYTADGLWLNGYAITIEELPKSVQFLKERINRWQWQYEYLFADFPPCSINQKIIKLYFIGSYPKFGETYRDRAKKEQINLNYKSFIKEGLEITKLLRKHLSNRYKIIYFNEITLKRKIIKKR